MKQFFYSRTRILMWMLQSCSCQKTSSKSKRLTGKALGLSTLWHPSIHMKGKLTSYIVFLALLEWHIQNKILIFTESPFCLSRPVFRLSLRGLGQPGHTPTLPTVIQIFFKRFLLRSASSQTFEAYMDAFFHHYFSIFSCPSSSIPTYGTDWLSD